MKIIALLAAGVVTLAILASSSAWSPATAATCKPGERKVGRTIFRFYCGPGRATVRTGGRSFSLVRGTCGWRPGAQLYVVDIGTETIDPPKPKARYLAIRVPHKRAGTYGNAAIGLQLKGKQYTLGRSKLTIAKDLKHGSFSGDFLFGPGSARGSWSC